MSFCSIAVYRSVTVDSRLFVLIHNMYVCEVSKNVAVSASDGLGLASVSGFTILFTSLLVAYVGYTKSNRTCTCTCMFSIWNVSAIKGCTILRSNHS